MNTKNIYFSILLSFIKGIGPIISNKLIERYGNVETAFENLDDLKNSSKRIYDIIISQYRDKSILDNINKELEFSDKHNINILTQNDANYPKLLKECIDAPIILYSKGDIDYNNKHIISIVGTRSCTNYGKDIIETFCRDLNENFNDIIIVSGVAYGIDYNAHYYSLKNNIKTSAVLAHGLDRIYPYTHRTLATRIIENGSLITEYPTCTKPERGNFLSRNRIIAGMSDAVIVVETSIKGGSIITANIANSYNREVFCFPGRITDNKSKGCNNLIKQNKAALIENYEDLISMMNWIKNEKTPIQYSISFGENDIENKILETLIKNDTIRINNLAIEISEPINILTSILLDLELKNLIKSYPGGIYKLKKNQ